MVLPNTSAAIQRQKPTPQQLKQHLADTFPTNGKVRAKQAAAYLGIGISTWWLYVKQGRVKPPMRYGERTSVWDADYVRELAEHGIPLAEGGLFND